MSQNRMAARAFLTPLAHSFAVLVAAAAFAVAADSVLAAEGDKPPSAESRRSLPGVIIEPTRPSGDDNNDAADDEDGGADRPGAAQQAPGCPLRQKNLDVFV